METELSQQLPKDFRCRILFSDIDGTLLNSSHHVAAGTREKILELDRRGIPFVMVSARMPDGVELIRREVGNQRPVICYSGGLVLDENRQVVYSRRMELRLAAEIKDALGERYPQVCCNTYGGNLWVVDDDKNPWVVREERITESKSLMGDIRECFGKEGGIHKFLLMGDPKPVREAESFLKSTYPQLSISRSNEYYLEVMDGGVDKAEGVRIVCGLYGIDPEEAAAFGDGENDVGMLGAVGYGFAMGNASEHVKSQAAYVTLSNDEEGILKVIERL